MKFTAIDLFSGCGGLSQGLKDAGFNVVAAVEIDVKAQQTYRLNHPEVSIYGVDIRNLQPLDVATAAGLCSGELDLLAGCPPCQGFSRLRTRNKLVAVSDPRNDLILEFLRFVEQLLPKTVLLENVPALMHDPRFNDLVAGLKDLNYRVNFGLLNACDYGVPQRRKRLMLSASRVSSAPLPAAPQDRITVRQAIAHLEPPSRTKDKLHGMKELRSPSVRKLISMIPKDGGSRRNLPIENQLICHTKSNGFSDVYGRMSWDDVAPTITSGCHNPSKGRFLHPSRNRAVTLREAAILQGFPREYRFEVAHGKEAIALMIGNALPPPLICAHATALKSSITQSVEATKLARQT